MYCHGSHLEYGKSILTLKGNLNTLIKGYTRIQFTEFEIRKLGV